MWLKVRGSHLRHISENGSPNVWVWMKVIERNKYELLSSFAVLCIVSVKETPDIKNMTSNMAYF